GEDTPRGDRPGTMEQWPEYPTANPAGAPKQTARVPQTCTPVAPVPHGQGAPCINLCNALPSVHPAHPALGPPTPARLVYPPYPAYAMATPYAPSPQIPPAMPWVPMDHLMQAQQAVALSAAATAVSLCSALAAPVLQAMPPTMLPSPILLPPQPCIPIPIMPTAPKPMEAAEQAEESQLEKRHRSRRSRLWVHIYLRMQLEGFDLVPRLIGRKGCNMRRIAEQTSAKVRIRGQGSGHLEIDGKYEAPTPLMIAVTTDHADPDMFKQAVQMTLTVLKAVEGCFRVFCSQKGIEHAGPCYCVGMLQPNAQAALGSLLDNVPLNSEHEESRVAPVTDG
ncbi:HET-E1, partial [Symbiodinium pilosum]